MDNQSAIEIIKNCTMLACEYHIKDKCDKDYSKREEDFEEAKKIAVEAIEKQIPQKPKSNKLGFRYSLCPKCLGGLFYGGHEKNGYCTNCGQAIDWGER